MRSDDELQCTALNDEELKTECTNYAFDSTACRPSRSSSSIAFVQASDSSRVNPGDVPSISFEACRIPKGFESPGFKFDIVWLTNR